MTEVAIFKT